MKPSSLIKRFMHKDSNYSDEHTKPRSLRVELLENRDLLSVSPTGLPVFDANNERQNLGLNVCVTSSLQESSLTPIDSSGCLGCLGYTEEISEMEFAEMQSFNAVIDELLLSANQNPKAPAETFVFNLNSCPGSTYTIYLDFNGNEYQDDPDSEVKYWNNGTKVTTHPYDSQSPRYNSDNTLNESYATTPSFTNTELRDIYEIWYRVSEEFIPFNVNVTTKDPGADKLLKSDANDAEYGIRVAIGGHSSDWYGESAGGVAYVGSFTWGTDTPCFVFPWNLTQTINNVTTPKPKSVALAIAHEVGHTLGLNHFGTTDGVEYYQGANGWAPIMGDGKHVSLTQWSKGEYPNANNTNQDDLATITTTNGFGYRNDDHGDSIATATPLTFDVSGTLGSGIIERNTDVDFFSFNLNGEGTFITIGGVDTVANLDAIVNLYNDSGQLVKTYDPLDTFYVAIDTRDPDLVPGRYYLGVAGTGRTVEGNVHYSDYGSLGAYTITTNPVCYLYEPNETYDDPYDLGLISGTKTLEDVLYIGAGDNDWYQFTIGAGSTSDDYIEISYTHDWDIHWVNLRLYSIDNNYAVTQIASSHVKYETEPDNGNDTQRISLAGRSAGTYRIRIFNTTRHNGTEPLFPYTLTIKAPVVATSASASVDSIELTNFTPDTITASVFLENGKAVDQDDSNVAYKWYRGTRSDFVTTPIKNANGGFYAGSSYTTTDADVGYFLTVKAFGVNGYEGTVSATTSAPVGLVEPVWDIVVTTENEDTVNNKNFNHTNDFNTENGMAQTISLREAYRYVNRYFVGSSLADLNDFDNNWRLVENENDLSYNASTGQYYYVDDGKCYVVFKTIEFANNVRNISLTGDIETNKSFTIKGSYVNENDIGVSISPALVLDVNDVPVSPAQYVRSRIFNVQQGSIVAENLVLKNGYGDKGGALKIAAGASYLARGGAFENNQATRGGAVYNEGIFTTTNGTSFTNNVATPVAGTANGTSFTNNVATPVAGENGSFGGAIFNKNGKVLIGDNVTQTQFSGNKATDLGTTPAGLQATSNYIKGYNGGAIYNSSGTVAVYNVDFSNNFAGKYGGAVSNFGTFNAINTTFENNVASAGGAVQNSGTVEFKGTTNFNQNTALKSRYLLVANSSDYGGNGGAIFTSGAGNSVTFLAKTTFDGNQAANAGGAIDFISGSLAFTGTGSKIYEFQKNVAGTIGGAIIVGGASVDTGDGVTAFEFHGGDNDDNRNAVKSFTPCSTINEEFHRTVETELDENNLPVNQTKARYAPNVAITCDVGDNSAIGNIAKGFFGDNVFQNSKLQDRRLVDVFERYATVTNGSVSFEDLAKSFSSTPNTIYYRVDDGSSFESLTNVNNNNVVTLTGIGSHKITYYADQNTNVVFVANFYVVDPNTSLKVDVNLFDLADRAYVCSDVYAVGVSVQVYSTSNNPVQTWKLCWDSKNNQPDDWETYDNFGFTCNAYHPYAAGTYKLKVKIDDSEPYGPFTITVPIPTPAEGEGSAILDAESDFFADLDLVDELFDD